MSGIWSTEKAWNWYGSRPWLCGVNYVPSTAVNTTELWQAETFDAKTIERELGWAGGIGLNTCRVFLQYLVWKADPEGQKKRLAEFLAISAKHGLSTMPTLFDDCAFSGKQPYLGPQVPPVPGAQMSDWTPSPGHERVEDRAAWPDLERYVADIVGAFASDERVVAWDIYNEPGNAKMDDRSLPLLEASFAWARGAKPVQPMTAGVWNTGLQNLNRVSVELSDVVTFHSYGELDEVKKLIAALKAHGKPVICTEWMRRTKESIFHTYLPVLKDENVGSYFWGLVNGKTQTQYPWGSKPGTPEPEVWFHDLYRRDGTPYRTEEVAFIRKFRGVD